LDLYIMAKTIWVALKGDHAHCRSAMTYESPWLTDDMRMFRSTVRKFLQSEFAPHQGRWSQQRRPDADAWLKAGRAGLLLTDVPEDYGGGGGNFGHQAV